MSIENLSPADVAKLLEDGSATLIDVREQEEWDNARIEGAQLFPLSSFDPAQLPSGNLVFLCAGGVRSVHAAMAAQAAGYAHNKHLAGGIVAWARAGLPLTR